MKLDLSILSLGLLLTACFGDKVPADSSSSGWPSGLEPVAPCDIDPPGAPGEHPEVLNLTSEEGEPGRVCAKGYVRAPLAAVRAAMATPEVVLNRREASEWSVTHDDPPAFDVGFTLHVTVPDIVEVEFDLHVDQGLITGVEAAPEHVAQRWEKVDGTPFIYLLKGSAQARAVDAEVTELELVELLHGATGGIAPSAVYIEDLFADIVAASHGDPLPDYD